MSGLSGEEALILSKKYTDNVALGDGAVPIPGPPGKQGETPQFRMSGINGNILQYRFATQSPAVWTDLHELPIVPYVHTQNIAAAAWVIPHNLNRQFVGVRANDFAGNILIPEIEYTSNNVVTLNFVFPTQGIATITT